MSQTFAHDALDMVEYAHAPSILVFADEAQDVARARRTVENLGYRLSGTTSLGEAVERLERQVAVDAVIVEVGAEPGPEFDVLLNRLQAEAEAGRFGALVSTPESLIDWVAARTCHERIHHLVRAGEAERLTALALAASQPPARVHDVRRQQAPRSLQQLSEEVGRIANILASLSAEEGEDEAPAPSAQRGQAGGPIEAGQVRAIIRARRLRDQYFSASLFADPAWDMLLDLMAARLERRRVAVSSLCIAAAVPATTALRWIKTLTDQGLFIRRADPQDGRRVYIELSDEAADGLEAYLRAAQRISPLLV